jgi:pyruvate,water dikinase
MAEDNWIRWFEEVSSDDVGVVGGKNASLGEMIRTLRQQGVAVPPGFATTAEAYRRFLDHNDLGDKLERTLDRYRRGKLSLSKAGRSVRQMFLEGELPAPVAQGIARAYDDLAARVGQDDPDVAVRSSATAEDLPDASFAGQQETFLNVTGKEALLDACRRCFASLFTDRAIAYREDRGFDHLEVALSVGVQQMVRADRAGSGVMFSIDTETGFPRAVLINATWGLGETVVQGTVDPDEYLVFKPLLGGAHRPILEKSLGQKGRKLVYAGKGKGTTRLRATSKRERASYVLEDDEILTLARWAALVEDHYGRPMDLEWAKDGDSGELWIVQARPETVQSRREAGQLKSYRLRKKGKRLVTGLSVGDAVATGKVCRLDDPTQRDRFEKGGVLVTGMTDPDWVPLMKRASAIVTDHGGRTSHAAIVSRELGLPAVVGTGDATEVLEDGAEVTVSCAEGDKGFVYRGIAEFDVEDVDLSSIPQTRTEVMLNLADPAASFRWWRLPADGVGLARMEFIIGNLIRVHPLALVRPGAVKDKEERRRIRELTRAYEDPSRYFVETLARGIARIAASRHPKPVIVRMSDFKTNEYAGLLGGAAFEPREENPMLGWRGASRYYSEGYRQGFDLECEAVRMVREEMGFENGKPPRTTPSSPGSWWAPGSTRSPSLPTASWRSSV